MTSRLTTARRLLAMPIALGRLEAQGRRPWSAVSDRRDRLLATTVALARTTELGGSQLRGLEVRTAADLAQVPCIDKAALRSAPPSAWMTGPIPVGSRIVRSTGTTGHMLSVAYPPDAAWSQGILDLHISLERRTTPLATRVSLSTVSDGRDGRVLGRLTNARRVTTGEHDPAAAADLIARRRPSIVHGAGGELVLAGEELRGRHRPKQVHTNGELLTAENRDAIRALYGTDPLDGYGMSEVGRIAWQCRERDLYHLNHGCLVIEVVDDAGLAVPPGGSGELVVTSLWNPLVPLVRYRTADRATVADRPCRCGHAHPALSTVDGRLMDLFIDRRGRRVAPQRLWLSLHAPPSLVQRMERYRVVQDEDRSVRIEVVAPEPIDPDAAATTAASYHRLLEVPTAVAQVGGFARDPSGRLRTFTSAAPRP